MKREKTPSLIQSLIPSVAMLTLALPAAAQEDVLKSPPLVGDPVHGESLVAGKGKVRVDGDWINWFSTATSIKGLKTGKGGFPKIKSDNPLDVYDALAFLRGRNHNIRRFSRDATHVLLTKAGLDKYARERLTDQAKVDIPAQYKKKQKVFVLYKVGAPGLDLGYVRPKNTKQRDALKPDKKIGYLMFEELRGMKGGPYEAAFLVDTDINLLAVEVRDAKGELDERLTQFAQRAVGKGGRGKYDEIRLAGGGRASRKLQKPLSDAFLLSMETIYMYEVEERDYFLF